MEDEPASGRRSKRRCVASKAAIPSAVHYVGYVEDDETPEMIMRKFEELSKVMDAAAAPQAAPDMGTAERAAPEQEGQVDATVTAAINADGGLTETQLLEIFKQTSVFNVRSAMAGNDCLMGFADQYDEDRAWSDEEFSDGEGLWDDVRGFWSDEDDEELGEGRGARRRRGERMPRGPSGAKIRHSIVTQYNATSQAYIRRKIRVVDRGEILQIKVPFPLPLAWGRTVIPFAPKGVKPPPPHAAEADAQEADPSKEASPAGRLLQVDSLAGPKLTSLLKQDFQAVMINPGWDITGDAESDDESAPRQALAALPLPKLCSRGFVFVWAEKHRLALVTRQMYKWGFSYVENLTWVLMHVNNTIMTLKAPYVHQSHITLMIYRKEGDGKDIELRHQRKPDVAFDCMRSSPGQPWAVPEEAYVAIETMLPTGKGQFLELWGAADAMAVRPGWTHIAQPPQKAEVH
ncbi:hypothetical protein WJX73_003191 [Symbiochloris irregularis]|uniref:MT-A70-domain-containing protein n=1 Tax=Symbiochloris irregularis TaxID=706552 RepID=A0AAW1PCE3_9CHLO